MIPPGQQGGGAVSVRELLAPLVVLLVVVRADDDRGMIDSAPGVALGGDRTLWIHDLEGIGEWKYCFDQPLGALECGISYTATTQTSFTTTLTECTMYKNCYAICDQMVQKEPGLCDTDFCPTCAQAHRCDETCKVCSDNATESLTTTTNGSCYKENLFHECDSLAFLCEHLFCPDCDSALAGVCDRTCGYCTTMVATASRSTDIGSTIAATGTTGTETSTSQFSIATLTMATYSSTTCSPRVDCLESCPQLIKFDRKCCTSVFCPTCSAARVCDTSCFEATGDSIFCSTGEGDSTDTSATTTATATSIAALSATEQCDDIVPDSLPGGVTEWHDSAGPDHTCSWYGEEDSRCKQVGYGDRKYGHVATEACCICGGGLREHATTMGCLSVNLWSEQMCEEAQTEESCCDVCETLFCPNCDGHAAGMCDRTCGFCTTLTTTSTLAGRTNSTTSPTIVSTVANSPDFTRTPTSTVTTITCPKLSDCLKHDICAKTRSSCETLYCPTCRHAHLCDTTCNVCAPVTDGTTPPLVNPLVISRTTTATTGSYATACVQVDDVPPEFVGHFEDSTHWCEEQCGPEYGLTIDGCGACKTLFCPTCGYRGWCDKTCGFCDRVTGTTTTPCPRCKIVANIPFSGCREPMECGESRTCVAYDPGSYGPCMNPLEFEFTCSEDPAARQDDLRRAWPLGGAWATLSQLIYARAPSAQVMDRDGMRFAELRSVSGHYSVHCQICGIGEVTTDLDPTCGAFRIRLSFGPNVLNRVSVDETMLEGYNVTLVSSCSSVGSTHSTVGLGMYVPKGPSVDIATEDCACTGVGTYEVTVEGSIPDNDNQYRLMISPVMAGAGSLPVGVTTEQVLDTCRDGEVPVHVHSGQVSVAADCENDDPMEVHQAIHSALVDVFMVQHSEVIVHDSTCQGERGGERRLVSRMPKHESWLASYTITADNSTGQLPDPNHPSFVTTCCEALKAHGLECLHDRFVSSTSGTSAPAASTSAESAGVAFSIQGPVEETPGPVHGQMNTIVTVLLLTAVFMVVCGVIFVWRLYKKAKNKSQLKNAQSLQDVQEKSFYSAHPESAVSSAPTKESLPFKSCDHEDLSLEQSTCNIVDADQDLPDLLRVNGLAGEGPTELVLLQQMEAQTKPADDNSEQSPKELQEAQQILDPRADVPEPPAKEQDLLQLPRMEPQVDYIQPEEEPASLSVFQRRAFFDESVSQLGFVVEWHPSQPLVVAARPGSQAALHGMAPGDRLAEICGVSTLGKTQSELLPLLKLRPLAIKFDRDELALSMDEPFVELVVAIQGCSWQLGYRALEQGSSGFGFDLTKTGHLPTVGAVREGSPAWIAGIMEGDGIFKVNGELAVNISKVALMDVLQQQPVLTIWRRPVGMSSNLRWIVPMV